MGVIARQSLKGTMVTYLGGFIGLLTTFVVQTRYLTPEEIGLKSVLVDTAALMLVGLAQLGTNTSIIRFYPYFKDEKHGDHGFYTLFMLIPLAGFAVFATAYVLAQDWIADVFGAKSPLFVQYWYVVLPITFFMLYQNVFEAYSNTLMRIVVPKLVRETLVKVFNLIVYLLYAFRLITITQFAWSFSVIYAVAAAINLAYLLSLKKISFRLDKTYLTPQLRHQIGLYTLFATASAFGTAIAPVMSAFFVSAQLGLAFTGIYAIATNMSQVIQMPYRSLGQISQPVISDAIKQGDVPRLSTTVKQVSLHQFIVGAVTFMAIWLNIDIIFRILPNGAYYAQGKYVVLILCTMQLLSSTQAVVSTVLNYSRYYGWALFFTLLLTASSILLNNWLLPVWEIEGAALATLLANVLYYGGMQLLVKKSVGISPLSAGLTHVAALFVVLCLVSAVWTHWLTPLLADAFVLRLLDSALRSMLLIGVFVYYVYHTHLSPQFNQMIDRIRSSLKK